MMSAVARRVVVALVLVVLALGAAQPVRAGESVRLHAAGSLRGALNEVAQAFTRAYGIPVAPVFGASGLSRERLEKGEAGNVFASADLGHPLKLQKDGKAGPVVVFARNEMCALTRPGLTVTSADLLDRMLDPAPKLGTSTPKADPSGDYAWEVFAKAESVKAGSRARLEAKALQLTGGPTAPAPPAGQSVYVYLLEQRLADIFLTYCTNANPAARQVLGAHVIALPPALAVGTDYGLTVLAGADQEKASKLAMFILSAQEQEILERYGFAAPTKPAR